MTYLGRSVRTIANGLAAAGLCVLLLFALCTLSDALLRAVAHQPLDFVRELGDLIAALAAASCLPSVVLAQGNITLRMLEHFLPQRYVQRLDIANAMVIAAILAGIAWQCWLYAAKSMRAHETTWMLEIPKAPFWYALDAILWVTFLAQIVVLLELVRSPETRA